MDRLTLSRLSYDGIDDTLRGVLGDPGRSVHARRLAVLVAVTLGRSGLAPDLVRVALDPVAPVGVRTRAVSALEALEPGGDLGVLRPLAETARQEDPARNLAMAVRHALFPEALSVRDLVGFARADAEADEEARRRGETPPPPPVTEGFTASPGPHAQLLRRLLSRKAPGLLADELHGALRELAGVPEPDTYEQQAALALVQEAADRLPDGSTADAVAQVVVGSGAADGPVWKRYPQVVVAATRDADGEERRALLAAVVQASAVRSRALGVGGEVVANRVRTHAVVGDLVAYSGGDVVWLLDRFRSEQDEDARRIWLSLVRQATSYADREVWEPVLEACLSESWSPEFVGIYLRRFAAQDVEGADADAARKEHEEWTGRDATLDAEQVVHDPPLPLQLDGVLDDSSVSPADAFARVLDLFDRDPEDARWSGSYGYLNSTGSKLWRALDSGRRDRLVALALEVVGSASVPFDEALWRNGRPLVGTRVVLEAISLLARTGRFDPAAVPGEALVAVTVAFMGWPYSTVDDISGARDALRDLAWSRQRDTFVGALAEAMGRPKRSQDLLLHLLPNWDDRLAGPLVASVRQFAVVPLDGLAAYDRTYILDRLMEHGVDAAVDIALEEIAALGRPSAAARAEDALDEGEGFTETELRMFWRSTEVFLLSPERVWRLIGDRFARDDDFARQWLLSMASKAHDHGQEWPDISVEWTGLVYRRLHRLLPPSGDVQRPSGASYSPTALDHVNSFRWTLIGGLTLRAEKEDVAEVRALRDEFPDAGLDRAVVNAERQHLTLYPVYPGPSEVLRMAADPARLPIRSDGELHRAVVSALGVVQDKIARDEQRDAAVFWSPVGRGTKADGLRPRDENYVSDRVSSMLRGLLEGRGIVVTRESEANRYDRTDLLVQAAPDASQGRTALASVTIEVKGSWHPEVLSAMSAQLVERYLAGTGRQYGVFLVVWFDPEVWSEEDASRKRASEKHDPTGLEAALRAQAEAAAADGYAVEPVVLRVPPAW